MNYEPLEFCKTAQPGPMVDALNKVIERLNDLTPQLKAKPGEGQKWAEEGLKAIRERKEAEAVAKEEAAKKAAEEAKAQGL